MKNRNIKHHDNWETPSWLYEKLNEEFNFDFDPCPINLEAITNETDGLLKEWGSSNFINPPYSRTLKEAFVMKSIKEAEKGKVCVMLLPVSTSTKIFQREILIHAKEIRFINRRLRFIGINTKGLPGNTNPMHDSMIVVFDGRCKNVDNVYIRLNTLPHPPSLNNREE